MAQVANLSRMLLSKWRCELPASDQSKSEGNLHILEEDLELYAFGRLHPSKTPDLKSHLEACDYCRERLREVSSFTEQIGELARRQQALTEERRREVRMPANDQAFVRILRPEVGPRGEARILETSKSGLLLEMAVPVEPGVELQVQLTDTMAFAEVRHCRPADEKFHVGVRLIDVIPFGNPQT
ncbi:MAG: hypothetical protein JWO19_5321 [Bryobacterales bacterium]|nr:hypothetical protein [Bryobacterales bacterium]